MEQSLLETRFSTLFKTPHEAFFFFSDFYGWYANYYYKNEIYQESYISRGNSFRSWSNVLEISLGFNVNIDAVHTNESLNELEQYNNRRTWHEHLYNTDNIHLGIIGIGITWF